MSVEDIVSYDLVSLRAAIRRGEVGLLDVAEAYIEKIHKENQWINAYVAHNPAQIIERAVSLQDRFESAADLPLYGVPFAIKDVTDVEGHPTTSGLAAYRSRVAQQNAPIVNRLQEAGGIFLGKTNTAELGFHAANATNSLFGATHNPSAPGKTPGGSSGAAAAAVASHTAVFAEGTDGAGSARTRSILRTCWFESHQRHYSSEK